MRKAFLIWSPGWTHISSGPRALHHLCHELNNFGEDAYLYPENPVGFALNPAQKTRLLPPEYSNYYGKNIIVVYPDNVRGNPLNAKYVVRWLLAPAGLYGGDKEFPATDSVWCFRQDIAAMQNSDNILCLPTFDPKIFYETSAKRSGTCYYAHKYDKIHGQKLLPITENSIRLEGSPKYISHILRTSEKCYLYEPSEIKVHAAMCGCPVEEVITPYFQGMGEQPDFFKAGRVMSYDDMYWKFRKQLECFIEKEQCKNF